MTIKLWLLDLCNMIENLNDNTYRLWINLIPHIFPEISGKITSYYWIHL
jgi:hypothetical protein